MNTKKVSSVRIFLNEPHAQTSEEVLLTLNSTMGGLSNEEASKRLEVYGPNEIAGSDANSPVLVFLKQFHSVLVYILFVAAGISYAFDHLVDAYVILFIIVLNAILGFTQEYRAHKAISALKKSMIVTAQVLRDNAVTEVDASTLVPGDIILLDAGMMVPADVRILESNGLQAAESSLTGESIPVQKTVDSLAQNVALADRANMAWMSTAVTKGTAYGVVVATGARTAIGKVATMLDEIDDSAQHFKDRTRTLSFQLGGFAITSATTLFLIGYFFRDIPFEEMFLFTVAALVSGIPTGLPAILSIVLAVGAYRMSKHNALVRTLAATETLGVTTTIVTDKTGTLTQNVMKVEEIVCNGGASNVQVTGEGWNAVGNFTQDNNPIAPLEQKQLAKLLHIAGQGSSAKLAKKSDTDTFHVLGDPTEAALTVLAHKAGLEAPILFAHEHTLDEIPFTSENRWRATLVELREHGEGFENFREVYVIGAPEAVLAASASHMTEHGYHKLTEEDRKKYEHTIEQLSSRALRVIGLAYRTLPSSTNDISETDIHSLVFVGMVGMKDPVRADVPDAILRAKKAGIRVIMATGDHKTTAIAIAKEIGLIDTHGTIRESAMTGTELEELSDAEFAKAVLHISVFARLEPKTKLRIAKVLQAHGHVVAMTGDGVNDALALKQADIGIAMGKVGTEVARQSSDIVLTDDNFASILKAVEEGRTVFTNTRQSATFLVSTNLAEHATMFCTMVMGLPLPLLPTQILWLNLVTDGVTGAPLAVEPSHSDSMSQKPRKKKENILSSEVLPFILLVVSVMACGTIYVFSLLLPEGLDKARTGAFAVMAFTQLFNIFNVRSLRDSVFAIGLWSNKMITYGLLASIALTLGVLYIPFLQGIFRFESLHVFELLSIVAISSSVLWLGEVYKFLRARHEHRRHSKKSV
jgi:P-type Ca2+ transporter type 2C